jgi:hypothetical protein
VIAVDKPVVSGDNTGIAVDDVWIHDAPTAPTSNAGRGRIDERVRGSALLAHDADAKLRGDFRV